MSGHKYDNAVAPHNAYGHCLALLESQVDATARAEHGVHLDLACGLAPIGVHVQDQLGLTYVGVDADRDTVLAVRERGFDAHIVDLRADDVEDQLRALLDGRRLASISMLDGLEHLVDGGAMLSAMASLMMENDAVGVLSVPNVAHYDVAAKLLLGAWQYTPTGLLDETHVHFYTRSSLSSDLRAAGLRVTEEKNVQLHVSDQHFPEGHPVLSDTTPIARFLRGLRRNADDDGATNQFVWAIRANQEPGRGRNEADRRAHQERPFLSVLVAAAGSRFPELRETLLCLAAQDLDGVEVFVIVHDLGPGQGREASNVVDQQVARLRARTTVLTCDESATAAALNLGAQRATGRLTAVLTAGDLPLAHWASAFREAATNSTGSVIRGSVVRQQAEHANVRGEVALRSVASPVAEYPESFSLWQHAVNDYSPTPSWAYPTHLHDYFGLAFDSSVETGAEWDFLVRAAELVGVVEVDGVIGLHRGEAREDLHGPIPAKPPLVRVRDRMDARPMLLPPGEARRLVDRMPVPPIIPRLEAQLGQALRELQMTQEHAANLEAIVKHLKGEQTRTARAHKREVKGLRRKLSRARSRVEGTGGAGDVPDQPQLDESSGIGLRSRLRRMRSAARGGPVQ